MTGSVLNKLELDVMQINELLDASEIVSKYKMPAMVVHPNLAAEAMAARMRVKGRYKIIIPIDWPKGENYGNIKFRGVSKSALECDGFEIYLTPNKTENDIKNEAKALTEFIKAHLGDYVEVRFVIGNLSKNKDDIISMCKGLLAVRSPTLIRSDVSLKLQQNKANTDVHNDFCDTVNTSGFHCPIKLSGNMNNLRSITSAPNVLRYAAGVQQAKIIIKEYTQQPTELREILADS